MDICAEIRILFSQ